jgi:serine/threonine protein kinase
VSKLTPLESKLPSISPEALSWLKTSLIYDPDKRATTRDLMKNNYFTRDDFIPRFETELRKTVDMERERDNFELKVRRKKKSRGSKVSLRQPLDDVKSNSGMESEDRFAPAIITHRSTIPPINNKAAYQQQGMKGMGITNAMTVGNAGGHHYSHHGYSQHKDAMQMPTPAAYAGHHKKKGTVVSHQTLTFPKIGKNNKF